MSINEHDYDSPSLAFAYAGNMQHICAAYFSAYFALKSSAYFKKILRYKPTFLAVVCHVSFAQIPCVFSNEKCWQMFGFLCLRFVIHRCLCNVHVLGDGTAVQVPVSDSSEMLRLQISTASQQPSVASSAKTSAGLFLPTTAAASVQQSISSAEQPVITAGSKFSHVVECGSGDSSRVTPGSSASQIPSLTLLLCNRGDTDKPVGVESVTSNGAGVSSTLRTTSSSLPQLQPVITCSSMSSAVSNGSTTQPEAVLHSSSLPPKTVESMSLPGTRESALNSKSAVGNTALSMPFATPLAVSLASQSSTSGTGNLSSLTSPAPAGGFAPTFGPLNPMVSSSLSVLQQPFQSTETSTPQQPQTKPAENDSSNPVSVGSFTNQPSISVSTGTADQFAVPAPIVSFTSAFGASLTQSSVSCVSGLSLSAPAAMAFGGTSAQTVSKDRNAPFQFGNFSTQPSVSSSVSSTTSSASSGFALSVASFGNSQQPSFRPVFGNPSSQQTALGFGSVTNNTAEQSFTGQPAASTTTSASSFGVLQRSGNQPASGSVGGFTCLSTNANPFGISQAGSGIFGGSVPKNDGQSTSSSSSVSAGSVLGSSAVEAFGSTVTKNGSQTTSGSFAAFPGTAGSNAFGSSSVQSGSAVFGSALAPNEPSSNSFGGFTGSSAFDGAGPTFGNSGIQQVASVFGGGSGPVLNGMPPATSTLQQSLPNGFHKSSPSVGPFAFTGKNEQTPSAASSLFVFGQSTITSGASGFPSSSSVPNFAASMPASPFTFGKLAV